MPENSNPIISQITTLVMFLGVIITAVLYGLMGLIFWIPWAVCIGVLFLCEYLFGRRKKRFYKNIGAFIAAAAIGVVFAAEYVRTAPDGLTVSTGPDGWGQALACIAFLPPIVVSLIVNICNIVYRLKREKAYKPSDRQP